LIQRLNKINDDLGAALDRLDTYDYRANQEFPNNWADTPKRK